MSHSFMQSSSQKGGYHLGLRFQRLLSSIRRVPITLAIVAAAVAAFFSDTLTSAWQLAQSDLTVAWWKMLTCHLTHWSFDQLFWDVLAFGVLGYLGEQTGRRRFVGLLLLSSLSVSLSVMLFHPKLTSYRGLSGVDSALFAYLACYVAEAGYRSRDRMCLLGGVVAGLVFIGKVTTEFYIGQTFFVESAGDFQSLRSAMLREPFQVLWSGSSPWSLAIRWAMHRAKNGAK